MVPGEVLYSQGRVAAHHKQDIFSMYDTVYKTYIFLSIDQPGSAGL